VKLDYVPLLQLQRDLYAIPRGAKRFRAYLRETIDWDAQDVRLPLLAMNPMGKDHVPAFLDRLLAEDADRYASEAAGEAARRLADVPGTVRLGLVVADDLAGGWTNRYAAEFAHRFDTGRLYDRGWAVGMLWTADEPSVRAAREEASAALYRLAHVVRHGPARTLRERMAQEGHAMAAAGCTAPTLDADDLAYTREVIEPFLDADDMRTAIEVLFGDAAGATLGFAPRGLSPWAGLALALHDARAEAC
jgi:hypothetical protein